MLMPLLGFGLAVHLPSRAHVHRLIACSTPLLCPLNISF